MLLSYIPVVQVFTAFRSIKLLTFSLLILLISACSISPDEQNKVDKDDASQSNPQSLPVACKQPAPVKDIWALEPILVKNGEITSTMSLEEKEKAIRAFISRKNQQYKICLKGEKKYEK